MSILGKLLALLVIFTTNCFADQASYNLGLQLAEQKREGAANALKNFNLSELPNFTDQPEASKYYGDVMQKSDGLKEAARIEAGKSQAACAVIESFPQRPIYKIDKNAEEMKKSQLIIDDTDGITGVSNPDYSSEQIRKLEVPSTDFEKSISTLSTMGAAQKEFDGRFIFSGKRLTCDNTILGYSSCCRNTGWGQDIGLAHCSDEEKKLGHDKEKGLTIYVGDYCSKKVLGVCTKHRKSYCDFSSKLARIVQEQGRAGQLKIKFGSAKKSNCRGLSPEEMQRIDFSKIDFQEFYTDLQGNMKMPNIDETSKRIENQVKQQYGMQR